MARKQKRKCKSFNLEDSPVVEGNECLLNNATEVSHLSYQLFE